MIAEVILTLIILLLLSFVFIIFGTYYRFRKTRVQEEKRNEE